MNQYNNPDEREVLRRYLNSRAVRVTFTKADGSTRVMVATTDPSRMPSNVAKLLTGSVKRAENPDVARVWDVEAHGWRSFRFDSIISVKALEG